MIHQPKEVLDSARLARLEELRSRHGFHAPAPDGRVRPSKISRELLAKPEGLEVRLDDGRLVTVAQDHDTWPKHHQIFDLATERLELLGFKWERNDGEKSRQGKRHTRFTNWPTHRGRQVTVLELLTMPLEEMDGAAALLAATADIRDQLGKPAGFERHVGSMNALHIGYKGIEDVSWLLGYRPFELPAHLETELEALGDAIFLLSDAVTALWGKDQLLTDILSHKVPGRIRKIMPPGARLELVRPDLAIFRGDDDGELHLVATELETAPAGEGMAHCMETGYDLASTMVERMVEYLDGRPYLVFMTKAWAEYVWEISVFVDALRKRGVDARVLFNEPLEAVHAWVNQPHDPAREEAGLPQLGWGKARDDMPEHIRCRWEENKDLLGRLTRYGFREFVGGASVADLSGSVGETVVKRFGYFDNLGDASIDLLLAWQQAGATIQNGLGFAFESKVMMAAAQVPAVRQWMRDRDERSVAVLDRHMAETRLLHERHIRLSALKGDDPRHEECRQLWLTKFPGFDGNEMSWGARSVEFGEDMSQTQWTRLVDRRMALPHPVVAQHAIRQELFVVPFVDWDGTVRLRTAQRPRFTPFLLRGKSGRAVHAGGTMTFRKDRKVHGATDAIETPVVFK